MVIANRPRWHGQAGFFEIWFLVVVDPAAARAWWLRWTTFAPAPGRPGAPRATLWAAAFDARNDALAIREVFSVADYRAGADAVRIGPGTLADGTCSGEVHDDGHVIAWSLRFTPAARAVRRGPRLLEHLPLSTRAAHANDDVACTGWVSIDGARHELRDAPACQKHLWGTRRVAQLLWLWCPRFAEDPGARLEATSARLRHGGPALTPIWAHTAGGGFDGRGLGRALAARAEVAAPGELRLRATTATHALAATATCDPRTLAGWVYRDPAGWDVHVAQSDVASCTLELRARRHPLAPWGPPERLACRHAAALEFHGPAPLPGVRYLPWDPGPGPTPP